ncbi:hypothetical protein TWF718_009859 [Orbilia javanica]|uniref:C2H2-type domain-containing protein n=1 Tax=Orbilia javanica TaxID=47235 RepID=A0AAN8MUB8_9PEZI
MPFVCLSELCVDPLPFFASFHIWKEHMISEHSEDWPQTVHSTAWCCDIGGCNEKIFYERAEFESHIREKPNRNYSENQISALAIRKERSIIRDAAICPLCEAKVGGGRAIEDHIGGHLHYLAHLCIPGATISFNEPHSEIQSTAEQTKGSSRAGSIYDPFTGAEKEEISFHDEDKTPKDSSGAADTYYSPPQWANQIAPVDRYYFMTRNYDPLADKLLQNIAENRLSSAEKVVKKLDPPSKSHSSTPKYDIACPFGNGDIVRSGINQLDLAGIRKHLSEERFRGLPPPELQQSNTWEEIFKICNPGWAPNTIYPSCYDSEDGGEGGGSDTGKKNAPKIKPLAEPLATEGIIRLACPFSKGDPAKFQRCNRIHKQNLPGIKEHLRQEHFDSELPREILAAKSWSDIFSLCNPERPPEVLCPTSGKEEHTIFPTSSGPWDEKVLESVLSRMVDTSTSQVAAETFPNHQHSSGHPTAFNHGDESSQSALPPSSIVGACSLNKGFASTASGLSAVDESVVLQDRDLSLPAKHSEAVPHSPVRHRRLADTTWDEPLENCAGGDEAVTSIESIYNAITSSTRLTDDEEYTLPREPQLESIGLKAEEMNCVEPWKHDAKNPSIRSLMNPIQLLSPQTTPEPKKYLIIVYRDLGSRGFFDASPETLGFDTIEELQALFEPWLSLEFKDLPFSWATMRFYTSLTNSYLESSRQVMEIAETVLKNSKSSRVPLFLERRPSL